jgi:hypothetical protein
MTVQAADNAVVPAENTGNLQFLRFAESIAIPVGAIIASAMLFAVFLLLIGKDPLQFYALVWTGGFGSSFSIQNSLQRAAPLILIGAGTGIGPLAVFVRAEGSRRPVHLWFGARSAETDLLYAEELATWQKDGRLDHLTCAFSRSTAQRRHVQDALRDDAEALRALVTHGARIMVCGGRDMDQGVQASLADILSPLGLTPRSLKAEGRYAEDSY